MTPLEKLIEELPPELQQEVEDFARFLLATKGGRNESDLRAKPTFDWVGAFRDMRDTYTSVELQHELSSGRTESA